MTVGERLREARERQKVSLHAIAEKTNISVRFLDAIEKNQFEKLPGGIFTRGFIRSYASQVGLDPDAAVAHFLDDEPGARDESDDGTPRQRDGFGFGVILAAGVAVILMTLALVYVFAPDWLSDGASAPSSSQEATLPDASAPASDATASHPSGAPTAALVDRVPLASSPEASVPAAAVPATTAPVGGQTGSASASPRAPLHLVVAPASRCWVQVSADGQMRVARELNAGERVTVEAAERLQIVVGDAGAFAYEINGRPGKSLGGSGRVARATILPATVAQFQNP